MVRFYAWSLGGVLNHRALTLLVMAATLAITVMLYVRTPKGYFPQDDTGLIWGGTQASTEVSFQAMYDLQQKAEAIVRADPAVANVGSSIGTSGWTASVNRGSLFISLKPLAERGGLTAQAVADAAAARRPPISRGCACSSFRCRMCGSAAARAIPPTSTRSGTPTIAELLAWAPRVLGEDPDACRAWSTSRPIASRAGCR